MDNEIVANINRQVARRFPELRGVRPAIGSHADKGNGAARYVLTYRTQISLPGNRSMTRIVHVTVDEKGRILRMSTSK
jgi:hypothetical protein